jgi:hypothetical protein
MDDDAGPPLPPALAALVAGDSAGRTLPVKLPPGRPVAAAARGRSGGTDIDNSGVPTTCWRLVGGAVTTHAQPTMQPLSSSHPVAARRVGPGTVGAALAGAAMGSASGPVTACELSAALPWDLGGACAPTGAIAGALGGALLGLAALPLSRSGRRRRQPAAHRPAATTWAAAGLMVAAVVAAVWVWLAELRATEEGLTSLLLLWLGVPVAVGGAVLLVLASGLLRRRGWARWGVVVGFSLAGVAALAALLATLTARQAGDPWLGRRLPEVAPPLVFLLLSVAVVVLVLWPSTAEDFATSGQTPGHHEDPRQQASAP